MLYSRNYHNTVSNYTPFFFFPKEGQVGGKPECESHKEMGEAGGREEVLDWLFAYKR